MAKKCIDADRLKQTIADNVYPVQDAFNSRDYGMFWTGGIEKAIDEQPAVDIAPRWIPVTERLPEKSGEYLVVLDSLIYFSWFYKDDGVWSFKNANITAWMPLPEPYKGGEQNG